MYILYVSCIHISIVTLYTTCIMYTRFHISMVPCIKVQLYIQLVSCIHGSMFPWVCICMYGYIAYIYMYHHVSMVLQFHESGFKQYTYTWVTTFPWFCGSMNLDLCNIHIHVPHIYVFMVLQFHESGFMQYTYIGTYKFILVHTHAGNCISMVPQFWIHVYMVILVHIHTANCVSMVTWFHGSGSICRVYIGIYTCFCGSMNTEPWKRGTTEPWNNKFIFL